jgi:tRNA nucleotidyltransferase (CCA-adding enzyme)
MTGDNSFRDAIWPQIQNAANFVKNNLASNGLGPQDASGKETQEYCVFSLQMNRSVRRQMRRTC